MKKHTLIPVVLGGLMGLSLSAQAQGRGPGEGGRGGASGQNIREALIKKFDKNGDGKLDEKERPTREQLQEFFRAQLGGGGAPGGRPGEGRPGGRPGEGRPGGRPGEGRPDGRPGEGRPGGRPGEGRPGGRPGEGRPGGRPGEGGRGGGFDREGMRAAMLKKFDKNGDGRLDEDERPSREEMQEFFRSQGGGGRPGQGGAGGRPGEGRPGEGRPGEGRPGEGRPGEGRPGGRGGFRPPANPLMTAIDANKDGVITAEEMKNAAKALATLDKNKDGKLDQDELRPQFGRGGSGRPGGGERPDLRRPGGGDRPDSRRRDPGSRPDFRRPGGDRPDSERRRPREGDQPRPKRSDA